MLHCLFNGFKPQEPNSRLIYVGTFKARRVLIFQVLLYIASYLSFMFVRYHVIYYHAHSCAKLFIYALLILACFICLCILIVFQDGTSTKYRQQDGIDAVCVFCV